MPFINLIQEHRLSIQRSERKTRSFLLLFIVSAVASGSGFAFLMLKTNSLSGEKQRLQVQLDKLQPLMDETAANNSKASQLLPRLNTLEDARELTGHWSGIFAHLKEQTPSKVWLTGLKAQGYDKKSPVSVSFIGISDGQDPVGEYIMRLQNCSELENVQLRFTQEKLVRDSAATEFEITGSVVGTAPPAVVEEGTE